MIQLEATVEGPDGQRRRLTLPPKPLLWIGRGDECDLVLDSEMVSRRHVAIRPEADGFEIDDRSVNGTKLLGERILCERRRHRGAQLRLEIAPYQLCLRRMPAPRQASKAPRTPCAGARGEGAGQLRRRIHRELLDQLDLVRLDPQKLSAEHLRPRVVEALHTICRRLLPQSSEAARDALVTELADEALGLGPLQCLLADPGVSEIMVVDAQTVYVERGGVIERTRQRFTDEDAVRSVIERIVTPLGRRIDESTPIVDARLPDGSRVHAIIPPLALRGPCITIRKLGDKRLDLKELIARGSLSREMAEFLHAAVRRRKNIVISGGTGSGKTTLLNVLSSAIPERERIVTIEDAAELRLSQSHVVPLETRPENREGKGEYSIRDLVKSALRMRPDRIVVGECRGGEAIDMLQAMNTGHEGSMTTTHANSPREAVARLETLCMMAGLDLPVRAVRHQIGSSIHIIVQQCRFADGTRRVTHVTEVVGLDEDGEVVLADLFLYEAARFRSTGHLPSFAQELST